MLAVLLSGIMTGAAAKKALRTRLVIVKPSAAEFPLGPLLRALICEPTAHGPFMVSADPLERPSGSRRSMRMPSVLLFTGLGVAALLALAWWYALIVPGQPHVGPLPPATSEEDDLATRLKQHVVAIASVPH